MTNKHNYQVEARNGGSRVTANQDVSIRLEAETAEQAIEKFRATMAAGEAYHVTLVREVD